MSLSKRNTFYPHSAIQPSLTIRILSAPKTMKNHLCFVCPELMYSIERFSYKTDHNSNNLLRTAIKACRDVCFT